MIFLTTPRGLWIGVEEAGPLWSTLSGPCGSDVQDFPFEQASLQELNPGVGK